MVRTQVQLHKQQYEALRRVAHRKHVSFSEAVRQAVDSGLRHALDSDAESNGPEALLGLSAIGKSGLKDLGRRHDRYLDEDLDK